MYLKYMHICLYIHRKIFWKNTQQIKVVIFREEDWMGSGGREVRTFTFILIISVVLYFHKHEFLSIFNVPTKDIKSLETREEESVQYGGAALASIKPRLPERQLLMMAKLYKRGKARKPNHVSQ